MVCNSNRPTHKTKKYQKMVSNSPMVNYFHRLFHRVLEKFAAVSLRGILQANAAWRSIKNISHINFEKVNLVLSHSND